MNYEKFSDGDIRSSALYPLRFTPIYKDYLWGGHRFGSLFRRPVPHEAVLAESWEVSDHPHGRSVVANGPLRGVTLNRIVRLKPLELFGGKTLEALGMPERFPLILKYLDAHTSLSIQVHPDSELSRKMGLPDPGKAEAWVVVAAEPHSRYYAGFNGNYDRRTVAEALLAGRLADLLHGIDAVVGDCIFLAPGTVHALGEGVLVAEVQTAGDTTFRLFDWNRLDADGNPRELHLDWALEAINYDLGPIRPIRPVFDEERHNEQLIDCADFRVRRWSFESHLLWHGDESCHLWTVLEGGVSAIFTAGRRVAPPYVSGRDNDPDAIEVLNRGDSILVPATTTAIRWVAENNEPVVLLDASLPY